jgi:hypothetical protein
MRERITFYSLLLMFLVMVAVPVSATEVNQCAPDGVAVGGFDLVSYHQEEGPRAGLVEYSVIHGGLTYRFVSAGNKDTFLQAPEDFLPVYQGWCATTLAMGRLACPDYSNYKLEKGRLLLFELAGFTNGRTLWNSDPGGFRQRADENARTLLNQR